MLIEIVKFIFYSFFIVMISKYILVETLRNLAKTFNLKPKTVGNIAGISTSVPELLTIVTSSIKGLFVKRICSESKKIRLSSKFKYHVN